MPLSSYLLPYTSKHNPDSCFHFPFFLFLKANDKNVSCTNTYTQMDQIKRRYKKNQLSDNKGIAYCSYC